MIQIFQTSSYFVKAETQAMSREKFGSWTLSKILVKLMVFNVVFLIVLLMNGIAYLITLGNQIQY